MHLTSKQIQILGIIVAGNGKDDKGKFIPCDLDQLIERVDYKPTKDAIQFSIRNLISKGVIEKSGTENRRDRRRVLISPTDLGKSVFKAETNPCWIEGDDEEELVSAAPSEI